MMPATSWTANAHVMCTKLGGISMLSEDALTIAEAIHQTLCSPNVMDKNLEAANVVDALGDIADALTRIADAIAGREI